LVNSPICSAWALTMMMMFFSFSSLAVPKESCKHPLHPLYIGYIMKRYDGCHVWHTHGACGRAHPAGSL
jgi:hypothetical protein